MKICKDSLDMGFYSFLKQKDVERIDHFDPDDCQIWTQKVPEEALLKSFVNNVRRLPKKGMVGSFLFSFKRSCYSILFNQQEKGHKELGN